MPQTASTTHVPVVCPANAAPEGAVWDREAPPTLRRYFAGSEAFQTQPYERPKKLHAFAYERFCGCHVLNPSPTIEGLLIGTDFGAGKAEYGTDSDHAIFCVPQMWAQVWVVWLACFGVGCMFGRAGPI